MVNMDAYKFSGRYIALQWDAKNMKVTNFEPANQFVRREYRKGWGSISI